MDSSLQTTAPVCEPHQYPHPDYLLWHIHEAIHNAIPVLMQGGRQDWPETPTRTEAGNQSQDLTPEPPTLRIPRHSSASQEEFGVAQERIAKLQAQVQKLE